MAKRNMFKIIEKRTNNIPANYDIYAGDIIELVNRYNENNDIYDLIVNTFAFGFEMGSRSERKKNDNNH